MIETKISRAEKLALKIATMQKEYEEIKKKEKSKKKEHHDKILKQMGSVLEKELGIFSADEALAVCQLLTLEFKTQEIIREKIDTALKGNILADKGE